MSRFPETGGVIITGGAQGIGRRMALMLAEEGVGVCIADWNEEKGKAVAGEGPHAERIIFAKTDVADSASCAGAVEAAVDTFGGLFGLVNNASIFSTLKMRPFWEIPEDEWDRVMDVNLTGVYKMTKAARTALVASGEGSVVNIASSTILFGRPEYTHYVSSKAGVWGMSRAMSREMGEDNVRVNTLTPGATFTEVERTTVTEEQKNAMIARQCLKRAAGPQDIADPVLFLLSRQSRWITGQLLNADGGMINH